MSNKSRTPLYMAICVVIGIVLGTFLTSKYGVNQPYIVNAGGNKINYLLQLIEGRYVDTVNTAELVEGAIPRILSELDPHSAYIPAKDAEDAEEDLKGSFSGIGVSFRMERDTVTVMSVIHGGPAEKVGILAGDRIIKADTQNLCKMQNTKVMKYLKGPKDTN
ncbi:MAG: PDZ domain-containing protein, partial [Bacteroidaceae bacterium]|nr:PDZ domain-containing protein [Bacteroidaceae bacterium]